MPILGIHSSHPAQFIVNRVSRIVDQVTVSMRLTFWNSGSMYHGVGMVGAVRRRSGDLNMRENYVFVFCLFRQDDIYCEAPVLAHAFCMACRSGDLG